MLQLFQEKVPASASNSAIGLDLSLSTSRLRWSVLPNRLCTLLFDYLAQHPEEASLFSKTMVGIHGEEAPAVAAAYDSSSFETVVDVGGATGNMLAAILTCHARPRGALFDRSHVVMLVLPGGQKRTEAEYRTLLGSAGFRLSRVVPTSSAVSVVEAVLA